MFGADYHVVNESNFMEYDGREVDTPDVVYKEELVSPIPSEPSADDRIARWKTSTLHLMEAEDGQTKPSPEVLQELHIDVSDPLTNEEPRNVSLPSFERRRKSN